MDLDEMEDADLREAIRVSLRDVDHGSSTSSPQQPPSNDVVDLTNDSDGQSDIVEVFPKSRSVVGSDTDDEAEDDIEDEDEDIKRAIAMSLQDQQPDEEPSQEVLPIHSKQASPLPASLGILGLNRKEMEQERLARLKKRKAESSITPPTQSPVKVPKIVSESAASKRPTITPSPTQPSSSAASSSSIRPTARPGIQYPLGTVRKTHVIKTRRGNNEITLEEVLQRSDLAYAVLSSYLWDMEWLFNKCDIWRTKFILIMSAKEQAMRDQMLDETKTMKHLRLCFPPMQGQVNIMHSKLMLLFHPEYLRIVVPTANLTLTDWGENELMENTVFLIDLPKKKDPSVETPKTFFYEELVYFLKASTLEEGMIRKLDSFDFSETARYAFVHTIGGNSGVHSDERWRRTGYCGLGRAVSHFGLQSSSLINVDYVASSIGSLNEDFLRAMYLAFKGDDGLSDYIMRYGKSSAIVPDDERKLMMGASKEWQDSFHVYFPSDKTAREAHRRPEDTAGTVCFQSKWWDGAKFPKHVMRDCQSEKSVMMHNKLAYVWPSEPIALADNMECKGWAYVGSANLSESAWGRLTKDRAANKPRMVCRNWECGVLVPIKTPVGTSPRISEAASVFSEGTTIPNNEPTPQPKSEYAPSEIFHNTVPIPMKLPAPALSGVRRPWFFMGDTS
ncbi:uncharacterized protein N7483_012337 [Penicillium malachiteum]|uniref:uncharacterized protein n=1 Tax=Penicillium malachiteum TaxID=1324776 RepID=UPI00254788FB|nr:uncharacterized protein N7483_012337 [Penicillium malachiteum]KAJ5715156.1 hypothetical protein N7483_012337 [Penicillium malachiteum]